MSISIVFDSTVSGFENFKPFNSFEDAHNALRFIDTDEEICFSVTLPSGKVMESNFDLEDGEKIDLRSMILFHASTLAQPGVLKSFDPDHPKDKGPDYYRAFCRELISITDDFKVFSHYLPIGETPKNRSYLQDAAFLRVMAPATEVYNLA